jgi:precorrin-6Y C5,15-methyltransferase (decarboxylating)
MSAKEDNMLQVKVIGIGPGNPELLTGEAQKALATCTLLAGDKRMLSQLESSGKRLFPTIKTAELVEIAKAADPERDILGILVSGDVGFFSLAQTIAGKLPDCRVERYCGISSLVYFAAKLGLAWEDAKIISMHGRNQNLVRAVRENKKVFALTGGENSVARLCAELTAHGLGALQVYAGESLSYSEEKLSRGTAAELAGQTFSSLAVMFVLNPQPVQAFSTRVHGLDDSLFLRGKAPMTKQEVRSVSISKLNPARDAVLYDVGAGTGSCSVEMALQAPLGKVYALEQKEEALGLLAENKKLFGTENLEIVPGEASASIPALPAPDGAFIGGSSGNMAAILDLLYAKNPACRIVINVIALETLAAVISYYQQKAGYTLDVVQIFAAENKKLGRYNLMMAQNPIYVITAVAEENYHA